MIKISQLISDFLIRMLTIRFRSSQIEYYSRLIFSSILILLSFCLIYPHFGLTKAFGQSNNFFISENAYGRIQFLKAWDTMDGAYQYGLFIDLKNNWKTYWKYPGNSGFTPKFQLTGSKNLKDFLVSWPAPEVFYEGDTKIYGFKEKLYLPIKIYPENLGNATNFEMRLDIGFCKDICIPETVYLKSVNAPPASKIQNQELLKYLRKVPINLESSENYVSCTVEKDQDNLNLISKFNSEFFKGKKNIMDAIFNYRGEEIWFSNKNQRSDKGTQIFSITLNHINDQSILLNKSKIEVTILTQERGFTLQGC